MRRSDLKLLIASAAVVVAAGLLVAGGLLVALRSGKSSGCGVLEVGSADDIRERLTEGGPETRTGGARCHFLLALDGREIVAYRLTIPGRDCAVRWKGSADTFACGGDPVDAADLQRYPTRTEKIDGVDTLLVDLTPAPSTTP